MEMAKTVNRKETVDKYRNLIRNGVASGVLCVGLAATVFGVQNASVESKKGLDAVNNNATIQLKVKKTKALRGQIKALRGQLDSADREWVRAYKEAAPGLNKDIIVLLSGAILFSSGLVVLVRGE
jgi:hypothetical protein